MGAESYEWLGRLESGSLGFDRSLFHDKGKGTPAVTACLQVSESFRIANTSYSGCVSIKQHFRLAHRIPEKPSARPPERASDPQL